MSGAPLPRQPRPSTGASRSSPQEQQQQHPIGVINPSLRPRFPPPLPPVNSPRPFLAQTEVSSFLAPSHLPAGRLSPLRTAPQDAEKKSSGARTSSPLPRPPALRADTHAIINSAGGSTPSSRLPATNPLSPQLQQELPKNTPRRASSGTAVSSAKTRRPMTGRTSRHDGHQETVPAGEDEVETLCPLPAQVGPVERFFVECRPTSTIENIDRGVEIDEDEFLFDRLAEYTDDDSFFSSGNSVLEEDPRRLQKDPLRGRAVRTAHETLQLRRLTQGRVPQELEDMKRDSVGWMYQVHQRAIALHHSSFFIFPPGMKARVVVYNVMHHWLMELLIICIIIGYSIFNATWSRHRISDLEKPDYIVFADVFYLSLHLVEMVARMFASGLILHPRAYLRSSWNCLDIVVFILMILNCTSVKYLWGFVVFRLVRVIKGFVYLPMPIRMKFLSKAVLRSTRRLFYVSVILFYTVFFFALLGLQLFRGAFHHRCVNIDTRVVTSQLCRPGASGESWFYWGRVCDPGYVCANDIFPNPHYDFRSFDDIGHAFLSTFQIMTFQNWSSLLRETNDALSAVAILYYVFTIVFCAWFVSSLYVGVFVEKIEKTSRFFLQKQLQLFDTMLVEQRQKINKAVKLRDFVERDKGGNLRPNALEVSHCDSSEQARVNNHANNNYDYAEEESTFLANTDSQTTAVGGNVIKRRTKWTNEQRVQLHLSLTRQRDLAEPHERKRQMAFKSSQTCLDGVERSGVVSSSSATQRTMVDGKFALGGRVGVVQHHPLTHTIGAAHGTNLPLAVRLENEKEQLRFLASYQQSEFDDIRSRNVAGVSELRGIVSRNAPVANDNSNREAVAPAGTLHTNVAEHNARYVEDKPPGILATRESAGVIPNRHSLPPGHGTVGRTEAVYTHNGTMLSDEPDSISEFSKPQEVLIHDPEGGDFRYATTCAQRWTIVRNILHMFTEGYPRILSQYLWEHKNMKRTIGILPLDYVNKYEEAALRRLRQRRALRDKKTNLNNFDGDKNDADYLEMESKIGDLKDENYIGGLSPIRMAKNIVENAPITFFSGVMLFFVFANGVFNASRHYGQPAYWDDALFIAGVCFTSVFTLEIIIRLIALGPGPYFLNITNVLCCLVTIIGFFELGFFRSNTITVLNWVQFFRVFRIAPFASLRRVTRVLLLGSFDVSYALIIFSVFVLMWSLLGMSLFGGYTELLDRANDDYKTRGFFDTFPSSMFAVSQAFSYNRDEWLFLSWDGMRARGGFTVLYFIAVAGVSFIFRFLFIAVFAWAWHREEEREDCVLERGGADVDCRYKGKRLRWFDFTVWRSFKHIHGGFRRRDVAPDEVFHLNQDMRRQLRLAQTKERIIREMSLRRGLSGDQQQHFFASSPSPNGDRASAQNPEAMTTPQFVNIGGQLQRLMENTPNLFASKKRGGEEEVFPSLAISQLRAENAQLRFARRYNSASVTLPPDVAQGERDEAQSFELSLTPINAENPNNTNATDNIEAYSYLQDESQRRPQSLDVAERGIRGARAEEGEREKQEVGMLGRETEMGEQRPIRAGMGYRQDDTAAEEEREEGEEANSVIDGVVFEHVLFNGPRLRYKHVTRERRHRTFERCLDCNTHKQMPLRAPPNVEQRTADELHAEHCHMAAVRSSRQLVLNTIMGYACLQKELGEPPTRDAVETVLGQAWSCGLLLFETIEYLSCADIDALENRTWDRTIEALQLQQWLIGLHVGEEQVGRATLAYILAHKTIQAREVTYKSFRSSWRERSLLLFLPDNPFRLKVTQLVKSKWFEWFIIAIIFVSAICLCFYNPLEKDRRSTKYTVLHMLDNIFAVIFALEMLLKWISMGVVLDVHVAYFWHKWNIFDCFITIVSLLAIAPAYFYFRCLKVLRCFRIFSPLQHCTFNEGLSKLATAIWNCVPTLANVLLLCMFNYIVWAILAVRLFMGLTHRCSDLLFSGKTSCLEAGESWNKTQRNFDNFYQSLLTMFEVSTGSRWLDTIYAGVDGWSMEYAPEANKYPFKEFFFILYYYVSNFVFFSLLIASLIYCYLLAKNAVEGAAGITFEHQLWIRMQRMILTLKPRAELLPLGNAFSRFLHRVVMHRTFELAMGVVLFFNLITMSLYWYGNSSKQEEALDALQHVWVAIFTLELIMRGVAHGLRAFSRWSFCFGIFVTFLSYLQIIINTTTTQKIPFNVNVLRLLHFGRLLNLVDLLPIRHHLRLLHEVLLLSTRALINVTIILILGVFVFAVLGMHFIGRILPVAGGFIDEKYNNFATFSNAIMMTFRLATLEDWVAMLRSSVSDGNVCDLSNCNTTNWAPVFYAAIVVCFVLLITTLYVAVVVDHYGTVVRMNASVTRIQDLRRFRTLWSKHDPNATLVLRTKHLPELLEALRPPLGLSSRHNRAEILRLLREYGIADHGGKVHYNDVLLPLARRVLAMAFSEDVVNDGAIFEVVWRISENTLRELPTVLARRVKATAAEHFAASYVQAVYRRKKARRLMQQLRADLWRDGRMACDELGLSYENYGVGVTSLLMDQPLLDTMQWAPSPVGSVENDETDAPPTPSTRLPSQYQPAHEDREKRFGPDVPNAVRRHETRSDKLRRREEERQCVESLDTTSSLPTGYRPSSRRPHGNEHQPPRGTNPNDWVNNEMTWPVSQPGMTATSSSVVAPPNTDNLAPTEEGEQTATVKGKSRVIKKD